MLLRENWGLGTLGAGQWSRLRQLYSKSSLEDCHCLGWVKQSEDKTFDPWIRRRSPEVELTLLAGDPTCREEPPGREGSPPREKAYSHLINLQAIAAHIIVPCPLVPCNTTFPLHSILPLSAHTIWAEYCRPLLAASNKQSISISELACRSVKQDRRC